jgi:hypothetical protein
MEYKDEVVPLFLKNFQVTGFGKLGCPGAFVMMPLNAQKRNESPSHSQLLLIRSDA